jgi:sulfoxide reductase heme-binding subunit YedZ
MERLLQKVDPFLQVSFRAHDGLSAFVAQHMRRIKVGLLLLAHLSLFGFFFPEMRKDFGEQARNLLLFILFLSPLSKIFRARLLIQLMTFRRELGIWFAYLATVHGVGYLLDPDWFAFVLTPELFDPASPQIRFLFGLIAYVLTLPLLLTSNNFSTRLLKSNWKRLHYLVYPLFVLVLFHNFVFPSSDATKVFEAFVILGAYLLFKLLAWRNFLPPLAELIRQIGSRYGTYQISLRSVPPSVTENAQQ